MINIDLKVAIYNGNVHCSWRALSYAQSKSHTEIVNGKITAVGN